MHTAVSSHIFLETKTGKCENVKLQTCMNFKLSTYQFSNINILMYHHILFNRIILIRWPWRAFCLEKLTKILLIDYLQSIVTVWAGAPLSAERWLQLYLFYYKRQIVMSKMFCLVINGEKLGMVGYELKIFYTRLY